MARLVTKPIHTLGEAVQTVDQQEGNFAAARALLPKDISADEIGTLTKEFDSMLGKIDTLIHENYEKQILLQEPGIRCCRHRSTRTSYTTPSER